MSPEEVDLLDDEEFFWRAAQARYLAEQEIERIAAGIAKALGDPGRGKG